MTTTALIRRATREDAGPVAELIATAFAPLPVVAWLVPEPADRPQIFTANFRIYVDHALEHGFIDLIAAGEGARAAAVWFPRTHPIPEPADYERRLADACDPWTDRFEVLDNLFEVAHPTEPHHHLAFLAVLPNEQGAGLGTALLRHHHASLDATATSAYLEASSPGSRELYLRHGYQDRDSFTMPDGPTFWPMWRPPHLPQPEM